MNYDEIALRINSDYYNLNPKQYHPDVVNYIMNELPTIPEKAAEKIFSKSWEDGHSYGYGEVLSYTVDNIHFVRGIMEDIRESHR